MAWNSQESISEIMDVPVQTAHDIIKNSENRQMSIFGKDFKPLLYSIWNQAKQDNDRADHITHNRDRKVVDLYLKAWNSQESIAELMDVKVLYCNTTTGMIQYY